MDLSNSCPAVPCYFFTALECEAKPLINHFKLKKDLSVTAFTIYRNADIALTVTGIGKAAMAAGVAYTLALFPTDSLPILLNVGIAGHRYYELGTVFVANKISDHETGRSYYPQLVCAPPCTTHRLVSVGQVQADYPSSAIYEMEAAAFYQTALRFSSSELIQCIKVISDNKENPSTQIKPAQVTRWISDALSLIEQFSQQLNALASLPPVFHTDSYADLMTQWHFTNSEKKQLYRLLNKRAVLSEHKALNVSDLPYTSAKELLSFLSEEVEGYAFGGF